MNPTSASTQPQVQIDTTLPPGLSPAQRDRILAYRTAVAQGVSPDSAVALVQSLGKPPGGVWNTVKRLLVKPAVLGVGDLTSSLAEIAATPTGIPGMSPMVVALQRALGIPGGPKQAGDLVRGTAAQAVQGLPEPASPAERVVAGGVRGLAASAPLGPFGGGVMAPLAGAIGGAAERGAAELGVPQQIGPLQPTQIIGALAGMAPGMIVSAAQRSTPKAEAGRVMNQALSQTEQGKPAPSELANYDVLYPPEKAAAIRMLERQSGQDVLGDAGQALAQRMAVEGGRAGREIVTRAKQSLKDAPVKFAQSVSKIMGKAGDVNFADRLEQTFKPNIDKLYTEASKQNVQLTPDIVNLLESSPNIAQAWRRNAADYNQGKAAAERIPSSWLDEQGNPLPEVPWRAFEGLKRAMDKLATLRGEHNPKQGGTAKTVAAADFNQQLNQLVDEQVPIGKEARSAAQELQLHREALDLGRQILAVKPDEANQAASLMTPQERVTARAGAVYAVQQAGRTGKFDAISKAEPALQALFSPDELKTLRGLKEETVSAMQSAKRVRDMGQTRTFVNQGPGKSAKLVFDWAASMRRAFTRDAMMAATEPSATISPEAKQVLVNVLGKDFDPLVVEQILQAAQRPGQTLRQGMAGAGAAVSQPRQ